MVSFNILEFMRQNTLMMPRDGPQIDKIISIFRETSLTNYSRRD